MAAPDNWQELAIQAIQKLKVKTGSPVFGLKLPMDWKPTLQIPARKGQLAQLLGVKAITFEGKQITALSPPEPPKAA